MNSIEYIDLLSIQIIKTSIEGIDNDLFLKEMNETDLSIDEKFLDNKNHTYYEDQRYPFGKSESEKLIKKITEKVVSILNKPMNLSEIWTLTLEYGQSVSIHSHKSNRFLDQTEYYSIAYYPKAPEGSADLIFDITACNTIEKSVSIKPESGSLIIFNSFLNHKTNRHNNKEEKRVVVSANFHPENPRISFDQDWSAYHRK